MCDGGYNRSLCHPILGDSKFIVLLKTVLTFNHKTNDAIVSKIDHTFYVFFVAENIQKSFNNCECLSD